MKLILITGILLLIFIILIQCLPSHKESQKKIYQDKVERYRDSVYLQKLTVAQYYSACNDSMAEVSYLKYNRYTDSVHKYDRLLDPIETFNEYQIHRQMQKWREYDAIKE